MNESAVEQMNDIHDIKPNQDANLLVIILAFGILGIIFTIILSAIIRYLYVLINKLLSKNRPRKVIIKEIKPKIDYKNVSINKLNILSQKINDGKVDLHFAFVELSEIVRWYIEGVFENKALKKTKTELEVMKVTKLNDILDKCYEIEFAQKSTDKLQAQEQVKLAINLIEQWV